MSHTDMIQSLSEELAAKMLTIGSLETALRDERTTAEMLRLGCEDLSRQIRELRAEMATMHADALIAAQSQVLTDAARPEPSAEVRTATDWIARLAMCTATAESTVRYNLTGSRPFSPLRDNAAAIDGVPLTQSVRLLDWLSDTVTDGMGHYRTRYEQLLHRHLSLESMLI